MADTASSPSFFILAFAEIYANITFVYNFMNESVSSFESCSLIKIFSCCVCLSIKIYYQSVYSCPGVLPFWSNFSAPQDFTVFIFWEHLYDLIVILHRSCSFWKNISLFLFAYKIYWFVIIYNFYFWCLPYVNLTHGASY